MGEWSTGSDWRRAMVTSVSIVPWDLAGRMEREGGVKYLSKTECDPGWGTTTVSEPCPREAYRSNMGPGVRASQNFGTVAHTFRAELLPRRHLAGTVIRGHDEIYFCITPASYY